MNQFLMPLKKLSTKTVGLNIKEIYALNVVKFCYKSWTKFRQNTRGFPKQKLMNKLLGCFPKELLKKNKLVF